MQAAGQYQHKLAEEGKLIWADLFKPSSEGARVVTDANGATTVQKGPFGEKVASGYAVVNCANLDEAIELASSFPNKEPNHGVEIRQIMTLEDFGAIPEEGKARAKALRELMAKNAQALPH
jgi:hypothetical protein